MKNLKTSKPTGEKKNSEKSTNEKKQDKSQTQSTGQMTQSEFTEKCVRISGEMARDLAMHMIETLYPKYGITFEPGIQTALGVTVALTSAKNLFGLLLVEAHAKDPDPNMMNVGLDAAIKDLREETRINWHNRHLIFGSSSNSGQRGH